MKKIYLLLTIPFVFSCERLPEATDVFGSGKQVSFLEVDKVNDVKVKDDSGSTQDTEIRLRIANPAEQDTYYRISVDGEIISKYNKENNVDYELLPSDNYEMTYTLNGVSKKGTSFEILVPKGQVASAGKLSFNVKPMKDASGVYLPQSNNYAIAVKMTPLDSEIIQQSNKETAIYFIRRSFKTKVARISDGAFRMIYGDDTGDQVAGKKIDGGDPEIKEWTMQYSVALERLINNWGLMYDNPRVNTHSILWNTVQDGGNFLMRYGAAATLVFNTPEGEKFKFEAAGTNPTADKWYHFTMTYKQVNGRPHLNIYVNGKMMFDSPSPVIAESFPLVCFANGTSVGYVREIRFWSKALTAGQAAATQYFVKPDADGLELYVPFNEEPWEEINETYESDTNRKKRLIKNKATNPKVYTKKWYLQYSGGKWAYPTTNFNTEVEF